MPLDLHPYEAAVVVGLPAPDPDVPPLPSDAPAGVVELSGPWTVAYTDAPDAPSDVSLPHRWEDDPGRADHSGGAVYATVVDVGSDSPGGRVLLDLGTVTEGASGADGEPGLRGASYRAEVAAPVGEVAQVLVNGVDCGWAWAPPYAVDITDAVRPGANTVTVRVLNTGLGALRADTALAATVEAATAAYGRRFTMQDLELAQRPTTSGLRAVPALRWLSDGRRSSGGPRAQG